MKRRINITIDDEIDKEFTEYCKEKGFKKSGLVERLIREYLTINNDSQKKEEKKTGVEQFYNPNF